MNLRLPLSAKMLTVGLRCLERVFSWVAYNTSGKPGRIYPGHGGIPPAIGILEECTPVLRWWLETLTAGWRSSSVGRIIRCTTSGKQQVITDGLIGNGLATGPSAILVEQSMKIRG